MLEMDPVETEEGFDSDSGITDFIKLQPMKFWKYVD
jgi:hypothetical protein